MKRKYTKGRLQLSDQIWEQALRLYPRFSTQEIADLLEVDRSTVVHRAKRHGVSLLPASYPRAHLPPLSELRREYQQLRSIRVMAKQHDVSYSTIRRALKGEVHR